MSRVRTITDGRNQTRTFDYDGLDRVTKVSFSDGQAVSYVYDGDGNRTEMDDSSGATTDVYDARNQLTEEDLPSGQITRYAWDPTGNMASVTDDGGTTIYTYNELNLLADLEEPGGAHTTFEYDSNNHRTLTTYPNGVGQRVHYDGNERIDWIRSRIGASGPLIHQLCYSYADPTGNATDVRQSVIDGVAQRKTIYSYRLNRLEEARTIVSDPVDENCNSTGSGSGNQTDDYSYTYDAASNRLTEDHNGTTSYTYNETNELSPVDDPGAGQTSYSYDANGNLTGTSDGRGIHYNEWNQTTSFQPAGSSTVTDFSYSGEDQRDRIQKGDIGYVTGLQGLLNERAGGTATYFIRDNAGALIGFHRSGQSYYYLTDAIGTVVEVTNPDGSVGASYSYDPYGDVTGSTGTVSQPYRFAGAYWDVESREYKLGMRYYDPATGRFTQDDPLTGYTDPREANPYIYAGDDPVNSTDPNGAFPFDPSVALKCYGEAAAGAVQEGPYGAVAGCAQSIAGSTAEYAGYHTLAKGIDLFGYARSAYSLGKGLIDEAPGFFGF